MQKIRALVVEDSLTIRKRIVNVLASDDAIDVVGEAGDGKIGIELCRELRPTVITLDMMLPLMSGVAVTEYVMAFFPTPILIVSASTNRGDLYRTYDALAAGAIDVLEKPLGAEPDGQWEQTLVARVKLVARIPVITHLRAKLTRSPPQLGRRYRATQDRADSPRVRVIALGASTGGPTAILTILGGLPRSLGVPILIVLHIGEAFSAALPQWLADQSGRPVRYADNGESLSALDASSVLLAPPGKHLQLQGDTLRLDDGPEQKGCRPSVDVLFDSLAKHCGSAAVACLLTGMGRDGAQGLLALRQAGGETIAQDRTSAVVFGMPGEAIRLGAAKHVAALSEISALLMQLIGTAA